VCQRPLSKCHGGLWEFPGGKIEPGESLLDAANRELTEELNVAAISVGEPLYSVHDEGSPFRAEHEIPRENSNGTRASG
jgi:8-oxo-dGTP pyrophosphatase MutT (NUDIX family)